MLLYRHDKFPNLCLLASLIVSISGSNSSVECTFSFVTNILSDKHLSVSHNTLVESPRFPLKQTRSQIDEHDEDDLDSEDERLVDELVFFNVDNDTIDVSDADK